MSLELAKNIRELRIKRNITQAELAEALGVSAQAISRWENDAKTSYPDIELLPLIAGYFEVTVDELMGCDSARMSDRLRRYWEEYELLKFEQADEKLELLRKMYAEYPRNIAVMNRICILISECPELRYSDGVLELVREITEYVMENYTHRWIRDYAVSCLISIETDERLEKTLNNYTTLTDISRYQLLQRRYDLAQKVGEQIDIDEEICQQNRLYAIFSFFGMERSWVTDAREYDFRHARIMLDMIDALTGIRGTNPVSGDGEVDLWSDERIYCGCLLAQDRCRNGDGEYALDILEDIIAFAEKICAVPEGTSLTYRSHAFDLLEAKMKYRTEGDIRIGVNALTPARDILVGLCYYPNYFTRVLTETNKGIDCFAAIRESERFKAIVKRALALERV